MEKIIDLEKEIMLGDELFKILEMVGDCKKLINKEGLIITVFDNPNLESNFSYGSKNSKTGYYTTIVNGKTQYVHRLVWELFNGAIPEGFEINHIDGNKSNNKLFNLELMTRKENLNEPIRCRRLSKAKKKRCYIIIDGVRIEKFSKEALINYMKKFYGISIVGFFQYGISKKYQDRITEFGYVQ
ncbi:HNH endonuclease signature motif containing protein [Clostridium saudiense]|uniref:HNH endonuclease signature motif containing protein n=1 Tax=Clostridium saudiense TaxID=1414720 RepID=UPI002671F0D5|nr:HNH endonuclease signature motif containing protein [Clostridium saudiense]